VPKIGPNDVLLRVRAAGVGLTAVIMTANPGRVTAFPRIPGHKVAGEVVELGSEVTYVRAGDRVTCHSTYHACREAARVGRTALLLDTR
jgi:D-arabinose 1-dehydrogenase-like Zn-dependent alcohol dehydrogenase